MLHVILESAALGLAGFDPMGLFVLLGAVSMGVRRLGVVTLMITTLGLTFVFGFIPVVTVGGSIIRLLDHVHRVDHHAWGGGAVLVGLGLLVAGIWRWRRGTVPEKEKSHAPRSTSPLGLALAGALVALSAFMDPAFYGIIAYASDHRSHTTSAVSILVWELLSHSGLVVVGLAMLVGLHAPVDRALSRMRERWSPHKGTIITVALVVAGLAAVVEGVAKWHGDWLLFS